MGIYDENRIKIVYCDQRRYDSSKHSDNEDKGVMGLIEISNNNNDEIMRPPIPEFDHDTGFDDMIYNDWSIYRRNSAGSVDMIVGQTFRTKDDLVGVIKQWHITHSILFYFTHDWLQEEEEEEEEE